MVQVLVFGGLGPAGLILNIEGLGLVQTALLLLGSQERDRFLRVAARHVVRYAHESIVVRVGIVDRDRDAEREVAARCAKVVE